LLRIATEIRNEIRQSLEAEQEAEREASVSRIQTLNAELSELNTAHQTLNEKHTALLNETQLLKEKQEQLKAELIIAQTKSTMHERALIDYKSDTEQSYQKAISEQGAQVVHLQQMVEKAQSQFLEALKEHSETHQNVVSDVIIKNENQRQRAMMNFDNERTRADKAETELKILQAEIDVERTNIDLMIKSHAVEKKDSEAKMRLEVQALSEQLVQIRLQVSEDLNQICTPLKTQMDDVLDKMLKLTPIKKKRKIET